MGKVSPEQAREMLAIAGCLHEPDFFTLSSETVETLLAQADSVKYRKPKNAKGSRARYFYALLLRRAKCRYFFPVAERLLRKNGFM